MAKKTTKSRASAKVAKGRGGGGQVAASAEADNKDSGSENILQIDEGDVAWKLVYPDGREEPFPYTLKQLKAMPIHRKLVFAAEEGPGAEVYEEVLDYVKLMARWLDTAIFNLDLAVLAGNDAVKDSAAAALAKHYVSVGKEYARETKKTKKGYLYSRLRHLMNDDQFRKHFESAKRIENHETLNQSATMAIIVEVLREVEGWAVLPRQTKSGEWEWHYDHVPPVYRDAATIIGPTLLFCSRYGAGDDAKRDQWWNLLLLPRIKERWPEFQKRYGKDLVSSKRNDIGKWSNALRRQHHTLWAERGQRLGDGWDRSPLPLNYRADVSAALMPRTS